MQGLTNRAMRRFFIDQVQPDTVFTEFVRVRPGARDGISQSDRAEIAQSSSGTPLVVQLIGSDSESLVAAAVGAERHGAQHVNINMGCPYARRSSNGAGGALLRNPTGLRTTLDALRSAISGSFSVKLRAGYEHPHEVFSLLSTFEEAGVDFLILHARTVQQKYDGLADHEITRQVCAQTSLPVIANGDINDAAYGHSLLESTGAAGLMLARGAMADPWLFCRLRGDRAATTTQAQRQREVCDYLQALTERYCQHFADDSLVLFRLKEVLHHIHDSWFHEVRQALRRCKSLHKFQALLENLPTRMGIEQPSALPL